MVGFALVLVVGILVADHFSKASQAQVNAEIASAEAQDYVRYAYAEPALPNPITPVESADPLLDARGGEPEPEPEPPVRTQSPLVDIVMGRPQDRPQLTADPIDTLASAGAAIRNGISQLGLDRSEPALRLDGAPPARREEPVREAAFEAAAASAPAPAVKGPELPVTRGRLLRHEVVRGDSLSKIAGKYYGDQSLWRKLQAYNAKSVGEDGMVRVGVTLLIPPKDVLLGEARLPEGAKATDASEGERVRPAPEKPASAKPAVRTYTVKPGDSLMQIAQKHLGAAKRWTEIRDLNKERLKDQDTIYVGMVLVLPPE